MRSVVPKNQLDPQEDTETTCGASGSYPCRDPKNQLDPQEDTETSRGWSCRPCRPACPKNQLDPQEDTETSGRLLAAATPASPKNQLDPQEDTETATMENAAVA